MPLNINFNSVSFAYPDSPTLFQNLTIELPEHQTILLKGENGVGKSTLAALAAGALAPLHGRVEYSSQEGSKLKPNDVYGRFTYLQQNTETNLLGLTPCADLRLWLMSAPKLLSNADTIISTLLANLHLEHNADEPLWNLSSGEQKCIALAGLSIFPERYWILDEPLAALDNSHLDWFIEILRSKQVQSRGMLIISHRTDLFRPLVDRLVTLEPEGKLRWED